MATINANKNSPRLVKGYLDVSYGLAEVPIFPVKSRKSAKRVGGRGWCAKTHTGLGVNGYDHFTENCHSGLVHLVCKYGCIFPIPPGLLLDTISPMSAFRSMARDLKFRRNFE